MDGFPQNHCRKQFGAILGVRGAAAVASDSEPTFVESGSAELPLRPESGEVVEDCSQHPAGNSRRLSLRSPFFHIVSARLVSDA